MYCKKIKNRARRVTCLPFCRLIERDETDYYIGGVMTFQR